MTIEKARKRIAECVNPHDSGLFCLGWYLGWNPEDNNATLDGQFTANELIAIAEHMKKHGRWNDH